MKFKVGDILKLKSIESLNIITCKVISIELEHDCYTIFILNSKYPNDSDIGIGLQISLPGMIEDAYECDYNFNEDLESILKE